MNADDRDARDQAQAKPWVRACVDYGGPAAFLVGFLVTRRRRCRRPGRWWRARPLALAVGFVVERRIAPMPLLAGGAALVFGVLTLVFNDDRFVKMKPTAINLAFGRRPARRLRAGQEPAEAADGRRPGHERGRAGAG